MWSAWKVPRRLIKELTEIQTDDNLMNIISFKTKIIALLVA